MVNFHLKIFTSQFHFCLGTLNPLRKLKWQDQFSFLTSYGESDTIISFWQQWAIQLFKFCLIWFLITENPYFQNLFNQRMTVTVCIETSIYMWCIIAGEVMVLTNTSRLLFYRTSVSNKTKRLDCAASLKLLHYPPNIYIFVQSGLLFVYCWWRPWQHRVFVYRFLKPQKNSEN